MTEKRHVVIVLPDGEQRAALVQALQRREATVHVYEDAMRALAKLGDLNPEAVLVGPDPGPPGAASLCRILARKRPSARVFRLADPSERDVLGSAATLLPPTAAPPDVVAHLLPPLPGDPEHGLDLCEVVVEPLQFARVLVTCADHHYSGRLWVTSATAEREVVLLSGMPVSTRSTHPDERLGQVALDMKLIEADALQDALTLSRARGLRLGEALLSREALDGYGLHRALCEQQLRRLTALCTERRCTVRFSEEREIAQRETLLRIHPLTAMLRALGGIPQVVVAAVLERVGGLSIACAHGSPAVDRYVQALGIHDLTGLLRHARNFAGLEQLVAPALGAVDGISGTQLCWLLLWSGVLAFGDDQPRSAAGQDDLLTALSLLPSLPLDGLWSAPAASPDDLPDGLSEYLFATSTRDLDRGSFAVEGPVAEGSPPLSDFLSHYYRVKGSRAPLHVLGLVRPAEPEVTRRAYLVAAAALDGLPVGPDPLALAAKREELRAQLEWAYGLLGERMSLSQAKEVGPAEDRSRPDSNAVVVPRVLTDPAARAGDVEQGNLGGSLLPSPEPIATMDLGLLREAEQYAEQGRWQDVVMSVITRYPDLSALPLPAQLLYAVSVREAPMAAAQAAGNHAQLTPEQLSIQAFSKMMGLPLDSPTVTILAKRLLRRPPPSWNQRPSPRLSFLATSMALLAGTAVGLWLQHNAAWSQRMLRAFW